MAEGFTKHPGKIRNGERGKGMPSSGSLAPILLAEDDKEDNILIQRAFRENKVPNPLVTVSNGTELLDYLYRRDGYSRLTTESYPCLVLVDLKLPRMDGKEALETIKRDKFLRKIPVVMMTQSQSLEEIFKSYDLGANSYLRKPSSFEGLVRTIKVLKEYWLEVVQLPPVRNSHSRD